MAGKKYILFLVCIFSLALVIRLLYVDTMPYGSHIDEASLGYNAYSIAQTGKDEYGKKFPLIFQAYGDQKLPAYIYATVPFVKLFGLSNFTVRLPGAVAGSILVIFIYLLLRQLRFSQNMSLLGSLVTSTSPWLIMLSRIFGYESGLGLLFFTIGLWASLSAIHSQKQWRYMCIAALAFALTWYSYIAYRVITIAVLLVIVLLFMRSKKLISVYAFGLLLLFFLLIVPLLFPGSSGAGTARFGQAVSTSMQGVVMKVDDDRSICAKSLPKTFCYLNSNKIKAYAETILQGYVKVLAPPYLFLEGDVGAEYVNVDGHGLLSIAILPLYLLGLLYFGNRLYTRKFTKYELFVLLGLLITPLPTLFFGTLQKVRLSGLYPFILITCMYGTQYVSGAIRINWHRKVISFFYGVGILLFLGFFMIDFLAIHVYKYEITLQTPIAKLMKYLGTLDKKTPVYIRTINEAIVLYAYYNAVNPQYFQDTVVRPPSDSGGFSHATDLGNVHRTDKNIDEIYCENKNLTNVIYATNVDLMKENRMKKPIMIIYSRDKVHDLYYVYDTRDIISKGIDCAFFSKRNHENVQ